jgi:hypothetical protein
MARIDDPARPRPVASKGDAMRRTIFNLAVSAVALVMVGGVLHTSGAATGLQGPVYPAPGGNVLGQSGSSIAAGGLTWTYTGFDGTRFSSLWWGLWDQSSVGLAMDGAIDQPGEILTFDQTQSDLSQGTLRFVGSTTIPDYPTGSSPVRTRMTLHVTDLSGAPLGLVDPSSIGASTVGGLSAVNGDYKANSLFEALSGSTWVPAKTFFDGHPKPASADSAMKVLINAGFFFIPPPSTLVAFPALVDTNGPTVYLKLSAQLTATKTGQPLANRPVSFFASSPGGGPADICDATTDANGIAACSAPQQVIDAVVGLGYDAGFVGGSDYLGSSGHGALVRVGATDIP